MNRYGLALDLIGVGAGFFLLLYALTVGPQGDVVNAGTGFLGVVAIGDVALRYQEGGRST